MNPVTRIDLYREQARRDGKLTLGAEQAAWLIALAEIGLDAQKGLVISRRGLPEAVIAAYDNDRPRRTRRRNAHAPQA
jgi:hypothetical protein